MTRRLVDAVQDIVIREEDCGQEHAHTVTREESEAIGEAFENRILEEHSPQIWWMKRQKKFLPRKERKNQEVLEDIPEMGMNSVSVRSVMTCQTQNGICRMCYGYDLETTV